MVAAAPKPPTLDDVIARVHAGEAIEFIAGEVVPREMSRPSHGRVQAKAAGALAPFNRKPGGPRGPGGWWIMTEVEVLYARTNELFRHDVVGLLREGDEPPPVEWPVKRRPDWACEILSPSTARYDLVKKQRTLHHHDVPFYWLIDPEAETLVVYRHGPDGYVNILSAAAGDTVRAPPFDAIELEISELLGV